MWLLLLLLLCFAHIEPVNLQDNFRLFLQSKENPCEGHVEIQYQNKWGYVGDKYWDNKTEEVVCRSTYCGKSLGSRDVRRSMKRTVWLNELKCNGTESNLWDCPGWPGPGVSYYQKPTVKRVKCSDEIKIQLNKHRCEGAVQYSTGDKTGFICSDNFGENEASQLCESLKCGGYKGTPNHKWMTEDTGNKPEFMKIDCSGIEEVTNLWQCVSGKADTCQPATVTCEGHNKLQLRGNQSNVCSGKLEKFSGSWNLDKFNGSDVGKVCKQMHCGEHGTFNETTKHLTCSDRVQVVLSDGFEETKCYGEVHIKVNDSVVVPVCTSSWTDDNAEMVCAELNCGKMIRSNLRPPSRLGSPGIMDHLKCEGGESSLWHCAAQHSKNLKCSSSPYVICSESMRVKLVDGPGRCAGKLSVKYEKNWRDVSSDGWTPELSDIVCQHLKCGKKRSQSTLNFKKGSNNLLKVERGQKTVSDMLEMYERFTANQNRQATDSFPPVGITCEEHKVVFLDGPKSCSGTVGIEQGDKTFWLSGSNETWNKQAAHLVCQQLNCGEALSFTSEPANDNESLSYSCSSNEKSLFECKETRPNNTQTVARVGCKGQDIQMGLTEGCWGFVNMTAAEERGGVCADTWTDDMSNKLCKELGCGDAITNKYNHYKTTSTKIAFKNFHTKKMATSLSRYSFAKAENIDVCYSNQAYVVCKGSVKPRFSASRDSCSGNVEIKFQDHWLPVCNESLGNTVTRNKICEELKCGEALNVIDFFGPMPEGNRFIKIQECAGNFSSCKISEEREGACKPGALQCSEWRKMALEVEHACKGEVTVYSKENSDDAEDTRKVVSIQGWTNDVGETLCKNMNCGKFIKYNNVTATEDDTFWEGTFNCSGKKDSIWECERRIAPQPDDKKLHIECQHTSQVSLSGGCFGEVKINGVPVCTSQWKPEYSHRVCQELNCGNAIDVPITGSRASSEETYYVYCDEHNYLLGQCKRVKGKCNGGHRVSISCTGSVKFDTTEKCGGEILITYRNKTEKLCEVNMLQKLSGKLCKEINCDADGANIEDRPSSRTDVNDIKTTLNCPNNYNDYKHCIKGHSCGSSVSSRIRCGGYVPPTPPPTPAPPTNPVPIIVGVGIFLILVILIVIFIRYRTLMRSRKSRATSSMQEAEWDSEEYDDIEQADEIEDSRDRFRSESEFMKEKDVDSLASVSYDDIDEVAEAQPLKSPGFTNDAPEGGADLKDDGVTYEVDDAQENYDDIVARREVKETSAEVHDGPQTAPERGPKAPADPEQSNDYVDPSQDG